MDGTFFNKVEGRFLTNSLDDNEEKRNSCTFLVIICSSTSVVAIFLKIILLRWSRFRFVFISQFLPFSSVFFSFFNPYKASLHATSLFWILCTTDFIKGKPGPWKVFETHVHFLYRCWWMQRWQAWLSREWNLYKYRWILWMCLQRWILWRRTQLFR